MNVMLLNPPSRHSTNIARDLFYGCWCKGKRIANQDFPPLPLLSIAAVLKQGGHRVTITDAQAEGKDLAAIGRLVKRQKPEALIIPSSTQTIREDAESLKYIKKRHEVKTMAFGSHVTFFPEQSLKLGGIDFCVRREPEYIIRDLVNSGMQNPESIKGLAFMQSGKLVQNDWYPFIENLDELPFPDRKYVSQFAYFSPIVKRLPWTTALTSRGCPGTCNFCTTTSFHGHRLRFRTAANVVSEMLELKRMGYNEVFFRDETFTSHSPRLDEICRLIAKERLDMAWLCNARIGNLNRKNITLMKKAGCHMVKIGVESGVQQILDNIRKGITVEQTRKTFKLLNDIGMESHAHVMLGCPGETMQTARKTIDFVKEISPSTVTFNAFTAFPGTPVFQMVKQKYPDIDGSEQDMSREHVTGFHNDVFSEISDEQLGRLVKGAYRSFYLRPSYVLRTISRMRSFDELRRTVSAGFEVFSFSTGIE